MDEKVAQLAQPKSMGYVITAISQICKSIVTNFNTNSSTATGSETEAIEKSPYFYFRLDENLAQSCKPITMGYKAISILQIYKSIPTHFNVNSLTATGSKIN